MKLTRKDREQLFYLFETHGDDWQSIAKSMGRTPKSVKREYENFPWDRFWETKDSLFSGNFD